MKICTGYRIRQLRNYHDLSMDKFGSIIGITRSSINKIEKDINNPSKQTLLLICKEFNVNYLWLTEGIGDMFIERSTSTIDQLAADYNLESEDCDFIKHYIELSKHDRDCFNKTLKKLVISK